MINVNGGKINMAKRCKNKLKGIWFVALIVALVGAFSVGLSALGISTYLGDLLGEVLAKVIAGIIGISALMTGYKLFID